MKVVKVEDTEVYDKDVCREDGAEGSESEDVIRKPQLVSVRMGQK